MKLTTVGLGTAAVTMVALAGLITGTAHASLPIQKKAKELGFTPTSCQYCHVDKLPKKGVQAFNDRGKWLSDEKAKRKAKEIDVAWLKEYVEKKAGDVKK